MKFADIPQLTRDGHYSTNVSWDYLEKWIVDHQEGLGKLDLDPDFQRTHVWTEDQQRAYVEFCLRGGKWSNLIRFNCVGWMKDFRGPFVLVDGKQRLEAVRKFLRNELVAFGHRFAEFEDRLRMGAGPDFVIQINGLETRQEVLRWYLEINSGGVVHTKEEIEKVQKMLDAEQRSTAKKPRKRK